MTLGLLRCLPECAIHVFDRESPRQETSIIEYGCGALLIAVDLPGALPQRDGILVGCQGWFIVWGGDVHLVIGIADGLGDTSIVAFGADLEPGHDDWE